MYIFFSTHASSFIKQLFLKQKTKTRIVLPYRIYVDCVYSIDLKKPNTTNTTGTAPYFDIHFEVDGEDRLSKKLYDKRDNFNVPIANFPFICNNIWSLYLY